MPKEITTVTVKYSMLRLQICLALCGLLRFFVQSEARKASIISAMANWVISGAEFYCCGKRVR